MENRLDLSTQFIDSRPGSKVNWKFPETLLSGGFSEVGAELCEFHKVFQVYCRASPYSSGTDTYMDAHGSAGVEHQ